MWIVKSIIAKRLSIKPGSRYLFASTDLKFKMRIPGFHLERKNRCHDYLYDII
jgi:hypothetical protein